MAANAKKMSLGGNVLWNTVGCVFYQGCQWLITVLVVRLSANFDNSGILSLAMSLGNIYFALATYNIRPYQVSDVWGRYASGDYVGLRVLTVFCAYLVFAVYALVTAGSALTMLSILAYLLFKADESFCNVLYGIDQRGMRLDYVGKSQIMRGVICVAVFAAGMVVTQQLPLALLAMAAACFAVTLTYDRRAAAGLADSIAPAFSRAKLGALLRECLPSVISLAVSGLVATAARQLFFFQYGEGALGIYATVATPAVLIQVMASNLYTPMLTPFAESVARGELDRARARARKLVALVLGVSVAVSLALSAVGDVLLPLVFGEAIRPYCYLLLPALLVAAGVALTALLADCLVAIRRLRTAMAVNLTAFAAMLVTFYPLVSLFYMNGLSFSLLAGYGASAIVGLVALSRGLRAAPATEETEVPHGC